MEYQKTANLLDNTSNQPSKFRTKNCVEINDESRGTYSIEYSNNYSETNESLWQYCKDIPAVNDNGDIVDFNGDNASDSFN